MSHWKQAGVYLVWGLFLAIFILSLVSLIWYRGNLQPVSLSDKTTQVFVVKKGASIDSIGQALVSRHLIKSPLVFKLAVTQKGLSQKIQAGSFKLSPSMSLPTILNELTHGTSDVWVTLLEGWRREEIASALSKAYADKGVDFDTQAFMSKTKDQEGMLYPDTYLLPLSASSADVVAILTKTFDQKLESLTAQIKASDLSLLQIITLASLLEREAKTESSRKIVAGILLNRLNLGMPLQVDATLQYVKGFDTKDQNWWTPPVSLDKNLKSPYNTYLNPGLPPGPIASPSLSSITAVLNPTASDYLYYLTGNDGQMHYAKTLEEHNLNIQKYL